MFFKNKQDPKHVLLIEMNHYHGHVIYPQIVLLLTAGYRITLLIAENQMERDLFYSLGDKISIIEIPRKGRWSFLLNLWRKTLRKSYSFIVFNTLDTPAQHFYAMIFPHKTHYVLHNIERAAHRSRIYYFSEYLFRRRCKKIYVLSERMCEIAKKHFPQWLAAKISYFHPSFFTLDNEFPAIDMPERVTFAIPGAVDFKRRNYNSLVRAFARLAESPLKDRVRIMIMGNFLTPTGRDIIVKAMRHNLLGSVILLQENAFEAFPEFAEKLKRTHFVVPLIDRTILKKYRYNQRTVPSNQMLSRGFAVPLLNSDDLEIDEDLKPFNVFYEGEDLYAGIVKCVELADSPEYDRMRATYQAHMKASFPKSQANYLGKSATDI